MDDLSTVLETLRLRGELYCRLEARAPWSMCAPPSPVATFHGLVRGNALLQIAGENDVRLVTGDLVVLCHGSGHAISDAPGRPATLIHDLLSAAQPSRLVRCGGRGTRATLVCGGFSVERDGPPLLALMPAALHLRGNELVARLLALLAREADVRSPGCSAFIARLTEALFVEVVREWTARSEGQGGARVAALRDSRIASALAAIHREPWKDWTVGALARQVGMSRSGFALTFAQHVGAPPLTYLMRSRLYAARVLLRESDHAIAQIAERVGYNSEASLSKAFKRHFGVPPGAYRRVVRTREPQPVSGVTRRLAVAD
jgi:AraC-like DNA-binding protein